MAILSESTASMASKSSAARVVLLDCSGPMRIAQQMLESRKLLLPLLHAVLAEESQTGCVGLEHGLGRMHLADCHQGDFGLGAIGTAAGFCDPVANAC
jgi:hypothetical protein